MWLRERESEREEQALTDLEFKIALHGVVRPGADEEEGSDGDVQALRMALHSHVYHVVAEYACGHTNGRVAGVDVERTPTQHKAYVSRG